MGELNIKEVKLKEAVNLDFSNHIISLKRDGCLIYFDGNNLISSRGVNRNDRFSHILKLLKDSGIAGCIGEMYIDGGNVFDVSSKENWNKAKFMPIDLIDTSHKTLRCRINYLNEMVKIINSPFITPFKIFNSFQEGWDYVKEHNEEGLVIRNDYSWYKVKVMNEAKLPIIRHEAGKDKGTFILENNSRISGTSMFFVEQYLDITNKGNIAIAEIEYPFLTKDNRFFQPRLRQITERKT